MVGEVDGGAEREREESEKRQTRERVSFDSLAHALARFLSLFSRADLSYFALLLRVVFFARITSLSKLSSLQREKERESTCFALT